MLVMRNFGYLGVHSSIHLNSKLACDRLVDFTGDTQVRTKLEGEAVEQIDDDRGRVYVIDAWHKKFVAEATVDGGRARNTSADHKMHATNSPLYAKELVHIPLAHDKANAEKGSRFIHTSFSNELILSPRCLLHSSKRNITVKIEVRRLAYNQEMNRLTAILPETPMIHNSRRGPFLVHETFLPCACHKVDPKFIDDVKIKLPLWFQSQSYDSSDDGNLVAFFSVYNVSVKVRKKWNLITNKGDEDEKTSPLEYLGCGYLPLSTHGKATCLLADDIHSVHLNYYARGLSTCSRESNEVDTESTKLPSDRDTLDEISSHRILTLESIEAQTNLNESNLDDIEINGNYQDRMVLRVQSTSFSSVHVQNVALSAFFQSIPQAPCCCVPKNRTFQQAFRIAKSDSLQHLEDQLLSHTSDIAKASVCPSYELVTHFIRINFHLWRTLVVGSGEPTLEWSNPASLIPLRLHSFSSLLQILNAVSTHLSKHGITELNGKGKWNMIIMSKIVAMLFDEEVILPGRNETWKPPMQDDLPFQQMDSKLDCETQRLCKDEKNYSNSTNQTNNVTMSSGPTKSLTRDDITVLAYDNKPNKPAPLRARSSSAPNANKLQVDSKIDFQPVDSSMASPRGRSFSAPNAKGLKIDTKIDFQAALNSMSSPNSGSPFGNISGPAANRRKWMTLPSSSLATIQEDNDKVDERKELYKLSIPKECDDHGDALDTELFKTKNNKVKQFRVPKVQQTPKSTDHTFLNESQINRETDSVVTNVDESLDGTGKVVPKTDKEIEDAGTAFLDRIGQNLGYK